MNTFLVLSLAFLLTFLLGRLLEKIRIPWIFAALLLGTIIALYNPFTAVTNSETFGFLSHVGMYFLLFLVGIELDLNQMKQHRTFLLHASFFIIGLEAIFGTALVHFAFGYDWMVSILIALSFATVGEAILVPILQEFKVLNTKLGQSIIGIGAFDDLIEIATLIFVTLLVGSESSSDIGAILLALMSLFVVTFGLTKLRKEGERFVYLPIESLFLLAIFVFFLFLGIGVIADAAPLAALLAGIGIRSFMPIERLALIEHEVKTLCYGFLAPIFFLDIGLHLDMSYLLTYPLWVLLVVLVSNGAKLLGAHIIGKKELGTKGSILLGMGLSVRFSTSLIIIKVLFDSGIIGEEIFSVIVASSIIFTFLVPVVFSRLLITWKKGLQKTGAI